ncbi:MAG: cytochrome c3 family protein [Deltaproteobacteria bacterium]|nr:cytochrome c3 family protein [Deltaproteobacteria bacterium]MBW1794233.1 cytochrome c3 family protein [Deltaproteobacteria bacterium]MBW2330135.1 cytochrome c3 family protein [Deltaproteobacteria bacterium]
MLKNQRTNHEKVAAFSATLVLILLLILFLPGNSSAKVTGVCSNCHTMHNSQGGSEMQTGFGSTSGEKATLLRVNGCLGCHASTDSAEWKNSLGAPIVYSSTGVPSNPLAGGNYYWVMNTGDGYGHNPVEIGNPDGLSDPPGIPHSVTGGFDLRCSGGNTGCHGDRYLDDSIAGFHHQNEGGTLTTANTVANSFRGILKVKGAEDPDWEQAPASAHNLYSGATSPPDPDTVITCRACHDGFGTLPYDTISGFCGACHPHFHRLEPDMYEHGGTQNSGGQWIRHPSDILLPQTGEYNGYPTYSAEAPVGYTDVSDPTRATAVVTCLSCHRAHGSPYPDMLRWDYTGMNAGGGTNTTGCFTCHTEKDTGS